MRSPWSTHHRLAAALVPVLLLATACGQQGGVEAAPDGLDGRYELVEGRGPEGPIVTIASAPVTLVVDGVTWGGTAACNSYGATVEVIGDALTVGEVFQTEMACLEDGVMETERAFLTAFARVDRYERNAGSLVLGGADVELVFTEIEPEEDRVLAGTSWVLGSIIEGDGPDGAVSSVIGAPTLLLDPDGTFTAETGCDTLAGSYTLDGDTLTFAEVTSTAASCPDEATTRQDERIRGLLETSATVSIEGAALTLLGEGGGGLGYTATDGPADGS